MTAIRSRTIFVALALILISRARVSPLPAVQSDTIPAQISDADFWRMIAEFSEPDGTYQYENFMSNEASIQNVIPPLKRVAKPGGVYLGVAPEQNFTYISALESKLAFVIDIRRQNMLEMLMYKALFEMSPTRADFVGHLFSRKLPDGLDRNTTAATLFAAYEKAPKSDVSVTVKSVRDTLAKHEHSLSGEDLLKIDFLVQVFARGGPSMDFDFASSTSPGGITETYTELMVATDRAGHNWSYLGSESAYQYVRELQRKNLIIPIVGDFAGPRSLRRIGEYLTARKANVTAFYVSNVERFLEGPKMTVFQSNLATLPVDSSSMLIRWVGSPNVQNLSWYSSSMGAVMTTLAPIGELVALSKAGRAPTTWVETVRSTKDPEIVVRRVLDPSLRRVSGKVVGVTGLKPGEFLKVELVENVRGTGLILHADVSPDGSFEFVNVLPRSYQAVILKSCSGCDYSMGIGTPSTVVVGATDVTGLQWTVRP